MKQLLTIAAAIALIIGVSIPAAAANPNGIATGSSATAAEAGVTAADAVAAQDVDLVLADGPAGTAERDSFSAEAKPKPKPVVVSYAASYSGPIQDVWKGMMSRLPVDGAHIGERFATYGGHFHGGIDFLAPKGTPIHATADGTVIKVGFQGTLGETVAIAHGGGIESWYGHMISGSPTVKAGQFVHAGDVIGYVGMTGSATAYHCHYEVHVNGAKVNPAPFLGL